MTNRTKQTYKELRAEQYAYHFRLYPYYKQWKKAPYTWLKGRFYMESSAILIYFLLKTKIKPNTITIFYGLAGIVCMVLLAIPTNTTVILALLIAFSKGVLDWSDGHFARITGQTSLSGHILDIYGATLNQLGFFTGLGFYVAAKTDSLYFYYLIPILLFMWATRLTVISRDIMFKQISSKVIINDALKINIKGSYKKKAYGDPMQGKLKEFFNEFLNGRSRNIDFICFIILLELAFPINITWIIFLLVILKHLLIFIGSLYIFWIGGWAENQIENKISELFTNSAKINEE